MYQKGENAQAAVRGSGCAGASHSFPSPSSRCQGAPRCVSVWSRDHMLPCMRVAALVQWGRLSHSLPSIDLAVPLIQCFSFDLSHTANAPSRALDFISANPVLRRFAFRWLSFNFFFIIGNPINPCILAIARYLSPLDLIRCSGANKACRCHSCAMLSLMSQGEVRLNLRNLLPSERTEAILQQQQTACHHLSS